MMWYNMLFGGKADKNKPSDFDPRELSRGKSIEREHTNDKHMMTEIAMDHLREDPDYYKKLEYVEKKTLPFIQKMLKEYEAKKKMEKKAAVPSMRELTGNYPLFATLAGAGIGAGTGLVTAPKEEKLKRTLRSALYGAAAGIGASERLTPLLEKSYKRLRAQRSLWGRIKSLKPRQGDVHEHWNKILREERPKNIAAMTVGGSAGLGLTDLGINAIKKIKDRDEFSSAQPAKKKKRQLVYVR